MLWRIECSLSLFLSFLDSHIYFNVALMIRWPPLLYKWAQSLPNVELNISMVSKVHRLLFFFFFSFRRAKSDTVWANEQKGKKKKHFVSCSLVAAEGRVSRLRPLFPVLWFHSQAEGIFRSADKISSLQDESLLSCRALLRHPALFFPPSLVLTSFICSDLWSGGRGVMWHDAGAAPPSDRASKDLLTLSPSPLSLS